MKTSTFWVLSSNETKWLNSVKFISSIQKKGGNKRRSLTPFIQLNLGTSNAEILVKILFDTTNTASGMICIFQM